MSNDPSDASTFARDDALDALFAELDTPRHLGDPSCALSEGFAQRVVDLHQARRRFRARAAAAVALATATCVGVFAIVNIAWRDSAGEVYARAPQTVALGDSAAAVLDAGAMLRYTVVDHIGDDTIDVHQPIGRAFYRVTPGTALTVHTPGGDVSVHGTCFYVDVSTDASNPKDLSMPNVKSHATFKSLAIGTLGAVLGATVSVLVVEGEVRVKNDFGEARALPGQSVVSSKTAAPTWQPSAVMPDAVTVSRVELEALRAASFGAVDLTALRTRNAELEQQLKRASDELALADQVRKADEGEPVAFPKDLPERFGGPQLQKALEAALEEAGVKGGVLDVDCSEYPCMAYGQIGSRDDMDRMRESAALSSYRDDDKSVSVWGVRNKKAGVAVDESYFGIAMMPDGAKLDPASQQRAERRFQQGWEKIKPKSE